MENLTHYTYFILEYCLFPFFLFMLTFFSERKNRTNLASPAYKLKASGYEFVLIEAFSLLSILVRIHSSLESLINDLLQATTIIIIICLSLIFILELFKKNSEDIDSNTFRLTFYSSFVAWWLSIIILGVFSRFLKVTEFYSLCDAYPWLSLIVILSLTLVLFDKIVSRHFITPNVLFREFTSLSRRELYTSAQKKGLFIFRRYHKRQGKEIYRIVMDVVLELGTSYYLENDEYKNKKGYGIKAMEAFTKHPSFKEYRNNDRYYMILAGLYYHRNEEEKAISIIREHVKKDGEKLIEFIKNKSYDKAFIIQ